MLIPLLKFFRLLLYIIFNKNKLIDPSMQISLNSKKLINI